MNYQSYKRLGVTETLIIINIIFFIPGLITFITRNDFLQNYISNIGNMNVNISALYTINNGAYWQFLTSMFLHGDIFHILFNMYGLYMFGKPVENVMGKSKFLFFYILSGVAANIASYAVFTLTGQSVSLLGASGALFAVLLAFGGYYPDTKLLIYFFIPLKVKWAILSFAVIELVSEITNTMGGIAHITHLFGFLFGFLILIAFFNMNPIQKLFFPRKDDFTVY